MPGEAKMDNDGFCPACGAERQPGMRFCGKCGHSFGPTDDTAAAVTSAVAVSDDAAGGPAGWALPDKPTARPASGIGIGGAVAAVGGIALVVGTALPWITATAAFVGTISRSGLEMGGDPMIVGAVGGLVAIGGGLISLRGRGVIAERLIPAVLGVVAGAVLVTDYQDLAGRVSSVTDAFTSGGNTVGVASIGVGFWVCVIGVVLAVASSVLPTRGRAAE